MRHRALAVILLVGFAIPAEAAPPVAVVLSQPIDASEVKGAKELASLVQQRLLDAYAEAWAAADGGGAGGVTSGRGAADVFATAPWQEEERRP